MAEPWVVLLNQSITDSWRNPIFLPVLPSTTASPPASRRLRLHIAWCKREMHRLLPAIWWRRHRYLLKVMTWVCYMLLYVCYGWLVNGRPPLTSIVEQLFTYTSSAAQGGGGSFKNRKPIGEVGCCESRMAERIHGWTDRCLELYFSWSGCNGCNGHLVGHLTHNCWM